MYLKRNISENEDALYVQYLCERYDMNSHDFLNYSPSDINWIINKYYQGTINQQTHILAQLIFELVMVTDGEWSLSDSNFTKDDIYAAIEHLCTVWCPAIVLVIVCVDV